MTTTYTVLGIISKFRDYLSIWEDVHCLYANTMPFYIMNLNNHEFWYWGGGFFEQIP